MIPGGSYHEVGRWLENFLVSHAKRESPRVEGVVEAGEERERKSYGVRLRLGDRCLPPLGESAVEFAYREVMEGRASFAWCEALAHRVREWARELLAGEPGHSSKSA